MAIVVPMKDKPGALISGSAQSLSTIRVVSQTVLCPMRTVTASGGGGGGSAGSSKAYAT